MSELISTEKAMMLSMAVAFGFGIGSMAAGVFRATVSMLITYLIVLVFGSSNKK